jgi:hypothetical protein
MSERPKSPQPQAPQLQAPQPPPYPPVAPPPYPPVSQAAYQPPPAPYAPTPLYGSPAPYTYQPPARSPEQWQAYVKMQIGSGRPPATLLAEMAQSGVPQPNAYQMVQDAIAGLRQRAYTMLLIGVVVAVVAFVLTVATEADARAHGGTYVILYGPLGLGVVAMVYGWILLRKVPRL